MRVHLDTSILIGAFASVDATRRLDAAVMRGDRLAISTLVLYEWARGPRSQEAVAAERALFGHHAIVPFAADEARLAADIYRRVRRPRGRELDIAIAACAIEHGAALWTINLRDFEDIPGLLLYRS